MGFNPRSPRGGATIKFVKSSIVLILFQSTLPTRGSDFNFRSFFKPDYGFNPRSPRGGANIIFCCGTADADVSIHAPHEGERQRRQTEKSTRKRGFNPRSPRGGATRLDMATGAAIPVSIHAPHEGERRLWRGDQAHRCNVSIHAPHEGERLQSRVPGGVAPPRFNPRSPRGGAPA